VPGIVNQAISESRDEIVVILSAGQVLPSNSLVSSLGWIDRDPILGMLSTAHHFLMPPPRDAFVKQFGTSGLDGEYMVLRRSMFVEVGGIPCEPLTLNSHIARSMNQVGLTHAYIAKILTIQNVAPLESTEVALCRLNNPFNARVFQWKLRADRYRSAIKSFQPLLRFVLVAIPLVYFLEHISPIKASAVVLLSYALPHFMQAYLFKDRLQKSGRPPLWIEIREIYLSIQMLLLTTLTVTLTKLNHVIEDLRGGKSATLGQSRWPLGAGDALLAIALCLAIISFILNEMQSVVVDRATDVLYAFWSGYVLMLLAARLAVAEEAQQIRLKKQIQLQMPAMVRLTNNRTFACSTTNFPKAHLQLLIPTELSLTPGIEVKVSVFHHFDEFAFQANVLSFGDSVLSIEIDKEFLDAYAAFANAAFARDEDWPKWLPDQDADQLVPAWVYKFPSWLSRNVMDLVRIFSKGRVNS
jgi:cellulose synthase (UDP-forming)